MLQENPEKPETNPNPAWPEKNDIQNIYISKNCSPESTQNQIDPNFLLSDFITRFGNMFKTATRIIAKTNVAFILAI